MREREREKGGYVSAMQQLVLPDQARDHHQRHIAQLVQHMYYHPPHAGIY